MSETIDIDKTGVCWNFVFVHDKSVAVIMFSIIQKYRIPATESTTTCITHQQQRDKGNYGTRKRNSQQF